jgi:hypothetical protein
MSVFVDDLKQLQQRCLLAEQLGVPPETILIDEVTFGSDSPTAAAELQNKN